MKLLLQPRIKWISELNVKHWIRRTKN